MRARRGWWFGRRMSLSLGVFNAYSDLKKVKSKQNGMADKWRRWVLEEELTPGCGPPPDAEEDIVML